MFRSLRGSTAAKNAQPAPVHTPPAFSGRKASSGFAPPPVRRVTPSSSSPVPAPAPEPEEDAQPGRAGEEAGAWAEALFDYTSEVRRCPPPPFFFFFKKKNFISQRVR